MPRLELDDGVVYDSDEEDAERGGAGDSDSEEVAADGEEMRSPRRVQLLPFLGRGGGKGGGVKHPVLYAHHCPAALKGYIGEFLDKMGRMADYMHEIVRAQAHGALARMAQCALIAAPPPAQDAFPVVDAALNAAHRALAEDDDRDSASAAMESAAEVIKSGRRRGRRNRAQSSARDTSSGLSDLCLAVLTSRAACQEGDDDVDVDFALGRGVATLLYERGRRRGGGARTDRAGGMREFLLGARRGGGRRARAGVRTSLRRVTQACVRHASGGSGWAYATSPWR